MAVALTVQSFSRTASVSLDDVAVAADGTGNKWANTGVEFLYVNNGGVGSITITQVFGANGTVDGQAGSARTTTVGAGKRMLIGPWPANFYNDASNFMTVTYSGVTTVTVAAVKYS